MDNLARTVPFPRAHARSSRSSSSSSSNGYEDTTASSTPGTYLSWCYEMYMGRPCTPGLAMQLEAWAEQIHEDVVEYAIIEASCAPRPSWAYINAILQKCRGIQYKRLEGCTIKTSVEYARSRSARSD